MTATHTVLLSITSRVIPLVFNSYLMIGIYYILPRFINPERVFGNHPGVGQVSFSVDQHGMVLLVFRSLFFMGHGWSFLDSPWFGGRFFLYPTREKEGVHHFRTDAVVGRSDGPALCSITQTPFCPTPAVRSGSAC